MGFAISLVHFASSIWFVFEKFQNLNFRIFQFRPYFWVVFGNVVMLELYTIKANNYKFNAGDGDATLHMPRIPTFYPYFFYTIIFDNLFNLFLGIRRFSDSRRLSQCLSAKKPSKQLRLESLLFYFQNFVGQIFQKVFISSLTYGVQKYECI